MTDDLPTSPRARLRHPGGARRPGVRSHDGRRHPPGALLVDVCPGRHRRPARRLRVRPQRQPDPHRARDAAGGDRGRPARAVVRVGPRRRGRPPARRARARRRGAARQRRLRRDVPPHRAHPRAVGSGRPRRRHERPRPRSRPRSRSARRASCGSRHRAIRCCASPTSPGSRGWATPPERSWSSTTRSPRPHCSSRSPTAPTSSSTRPRSTSAATPTSSAGRS